MLVTPRNKTGKVNTFYKIIIRYHFHPYGFYHLITVEIIFFVISQKLKKMKPSPVRLN
jgi:hypothetical protein